jgi:iron complex outermembrane recepter protein
MVTNPKLTHAVHFALVSTATAAASLYTPEAISQDAELEQIVVTGSRIRRVDTETASPVFTMDRGTIEASGVTTMGALVQQVPSISGAATNPAVNNGGGTGASTVELRGLGAQRTLVLLNGRRVGAISTTSGPASVGVDVNMMPVNLIERVEVLKEGAGAVYGSDAIGGVVNFITRKDVEGLELGYDYGISDAGDGARQAVSLAWGMKGERGNVLIGANYSKQDPVYAGARKFSRDALYLYNGSVTKGGSSRTPNGRIRFSASDPTSAALNAVYKCKVSSGQFSLIKRDGASGSNPLTDYRCFSAPADLYNYQPINLVMTPQERTSVFTSGNYDLTDDVQVYAEWLHSYVTSGWLIAELPFDARDDNIVIPANNYYNPFGVAFGGPDNPRAAWRMKSLGQRQANVNSTANQVTLGIKGKVLDSSWTWDLSGIYADSKQDYSVKGYLLYDKLKLAVGPSFLNPATNSVVCGTPGNIIAGCLPINIFDVNNPNQKLALGAITAKYGQNYGYDNKTAALDFAGDLFKLPAGMVQAAVGFSYNKQSLVFNTDTLTVLQPPGYINCALSQETCSSDSKGDFDVKEVYGEVLVPLLKDLPGAQALNLTLGTRYSDYNTIGSTTNSSIKLEWRPIHDLLLRGSWAEVFRAPSILNLYGGKLITSAGFKDLCTGLTQATLDSNPNYALACQNVAPDGQFSLDNGQITGLITSNPDLKPETGDVFTGGFVYEPQWVTGLSMNVDYWQYKLNDVITSSNVNTIQSVCVQTGDPKFCNFIHRSADGQPIYVEQPTLNFGKLETSGVDFGIKYALRDTAAGSFQFTLDATYIDKYDSTVCSTCSPIHVAGTYDRQYGNYAKWRGLASIGWSYEPMTALLTARYVGSLKITDADGLIVNSPSLPIPSVTYLDLSVGYTFWEKLTVTAGVDNLTNKQPPNFYQNNVDNANTDVSTYDTIGTFWRMGVKYKF